MNKKIKGSLWIVFGVIGFVSLIVASYGIGFHLESTIDKTPYASFNLTDLIKADKIVLIGKDTSFMKDIAGLWITAIVIGAVVMLLSIANGVGLILNIKIFTDKTHIWDYSLIGINVLIIIFMIVGIIIGTTNLPIKAPFTGLIIAEIDKGYEVGLYIMSILPLALSIIPTFISLKK